MKESMNNNLSVALNNHPINILTIFAGPECQRLFALDGAIFRVAVQDAPTTIVRLKAHGLSRQVEMLRRELRKWQEAAA